jgi:hypothetical protein
MERETMAVRPNFLAFATGPLMPFGDPIALTRALAWASAAQDAALLVSGDVNGWGSAETIPGFAICGLLHELYSRSEMGALCEVPAVRAHRRTDGLQALLVWEHTGVRVEEEEEGEEEADGYEAQFFDDGTVRIQRLQYGIRIELFTYNDRDAKSWATPRAWRLTTKLVDELCRWER